MRFPVGIVAVIVLAVGFMGCGASDSPPASSDGPVADLVEQDAPEPVVSAPGEKRFYGLESFTVVRRLEGMQSGTITEHVRKWGNERVEIRELEVGFGGFKQKLRQRSITQGEWVTQVDLDRGTATKTKNPMYGPMLENMDDPREFGEQMMRQMGGRETGKTETYAGESCNVWQNAQLGQTLCLTHDGIMLHTATNMGGAKVTDTAIEVRRGDPGPDSAYEVPKDMGVRKGPDIEELMKKMRGMPRPQ